MAIIKRTIISQVEIGAEGPTGVRLDKQVYDENQDQVLAHEYHRTAILPDVSTLEQMAAVNDHLEAMGYPAIGADVLAVIEAHRAVAKNPADTLRSKMSAASQRVIADGVALTKRLKEAQASQAEAEKARDLAKSDLEAAKAAEAELLTRLEVVRSSVPESTS